MEGSPEGLQAQAAVAGQATGEGSGREDREQQQPPVLWTWGNCSERSKEASTRHTGLVI